MYSFRRPGFSPQRSPQLPALLLLPSPDVQPHAASHKQTLQAIMCWRNTASDHDVIEPQGGQRATSGHRLVQRQAAQLRPTPASRHTRHEAHHWLKQHAQARRTGPRHSPSYVLHASFPLSPSPCGLHSSIEATIEGTAVSKLHVKCHPHCACACS